MILMMKYVRLVDIVLVIGNKLLILIGLMMKMVIKYIVIREYAVFVVEKKLLLI